MRLLVDGFLYTFQKFGGINRYFDELLTRLPASIQISVTIPPEFRPSPAVMRRARVLDYKPARFPQASWWPAIEPYYFGARTASARPDLLHPTYYYFLYDRMRPKALKPKCPIVLTVYDFTIRKFPEHFQGAEKVWQAQCRAIESADALLCISESTRRDLLEYFPGAAAKSFTVPLASALSAGHPIDPSPLPTRDERYFVFVGGRLGYKGFQDAVRALALVIAQEPDVRIKVVGSPSTPEEAALIHAAGVGDRIDFVGPLEDPEMIRCYQGAVGLLYPSHYEGFGIPPLEAMECKTPVIACATSSLFEVVADAGILVPPAAPEALTEAMLRLLRDQDFRSDLIERGTRNAARFSWQRVADETYKVYQSLVGG